MADDNVELTLLPDDLFIRAIDVALVDKIALSTPLDPLVLSALQALDEERPSFCAPSGRTGSTRRGSSTSRGVSTCPRGPAMTLSPPSTSRLRGATGACSGPRTSWLGTFGGLG
jgi:hypothetical protein